MRYLNLITSGGGTTEPSDFPFEQIILSGEDLTSLGYRDLSSDLILDQSTAPILWEIYGNGVDSVFTILAIDSGSTDKKFWIYIE